MYGTAPASDDPVLALAVIPAWMRDAACVEHSTNADAWFPAKGRSSAPAKAICSRCLVRDDCLAFAIAERISEGVWGGLGPMERRKLTRLGPASM